MTDNFYMQLAINEAWKYQGLTYPNPAVGAVVVNENGKILSVSAHKKAGFLHAEVEAIKEVFYKLQPNSNLKNLTNPNEIYKYLFNNHNDIFKNFTIYVTLEPCNHQGKTPPCSKIIKELGFKKVVIGTLDENLNATGGCELLKQNGIEVKTGCLEEQAKSLITPFNLWQKEKFIFFKFASHLNGSFANEIITSKQSRKVVHKLRETIDLLVIGGETVRIDRPTLDCRLVNAHNAPDVLIYSKQKNFDKTIPLFSVPNRKVFIENNFDRLSKYNYIMIEGGEGMFKATKNLVDWYLVFMSNKFKSGKNINFDLELEKKFVLELDDDIIYWGAK
jgi:diaminohydroxyphosphoribosylaminopyrimidine deaminase/5-amino-6-(5-phosphoribosylamino)uracil reductase